MSGYYLDWFADERQDALDDAAHDLWAETATECAHCGHMWQAGYHPATRIDPAYEEQAECPRCGRIPEMTNITDQEMVAELLRFNPFGGYRIPQNQRERAILSKTLKNYRHRAKGPAMTRKCPTCLGTCHWHDEAWVCDECGDEFYKL